MPENLSQSGRWWIWWRTRQNRRNLRQIDKGGLMRIRAFRRERYGFPPDIKRETMREWWTRITHSTGSPFRGVQRRCNYGLTNAEWNALTYEERDALNKVARA